METARRFFAETRLVTDTSGVELPTGRLGLAFDHVSTALDALDGQHPDLWALGKLHAYREQAAPFLHIDSDVYLWKAPPATLTAAPVLAAYPEHVRYGQSMYRCASLRAEVRRAGGWHPAELDSYVPIGGMLRAENCGILGGADVAFLSFDADQAIRLIEHPVNQRVWPRRQLLMEDMIIFEQHMLSACLDYHRDRAGSPFRGIDVRYMFPTFDAALAHSGRAGFTHPIAHSKRHPEVLRRLRARVRKDYPALYERALALTKTSVR